MSSEQTHSTPARDNARTTTPGRTFTIVGFVLAALGLFILPIIFGPAGAILGGVGYGKGDRLGMWAVAAGIAATIIGMALGLWIMNTQT